MRITESRLRQLIREALSPEDEEFIQGLIDDLRAVEIAVSEVESLDDDAPPDERKDKLDNLSDAIRAVLSYEGQDLEIGKDPEELEMLAAAGFDPESIKQIIGYTMKAHEEAEKILKNSPAPKTAARPGLPSASPLNMCDGAPCPPGKIPDWARRDPNVNYEPFYSEWEKKGGNIYNPLAPWSRKR